MKNVPSWDLSDLYKSINDHKITTDKKWVVAKTKSFIKNYKGKVSKNDALLAIGLYEEIINKLSILSGYSHLVFTTNTNNTDVSKFFQNVTEFETEIASELIWFELELVKVKGIKNLKEYKHFISNLLIQSKYKLDEKNEVIINEKNQTGKDAFIKLYEKITSNEKYDGKTNSEISSMFSYDKNRNNRKKAGRIISKTIDKNIDNYTHIINTLLLDRKVANKLRGFKYPEQSTFINYEVTKDMVTNMSNVVVKNHDICRKYYQAKSVLTKNKLFEWDRYNSIYPDLKVNYPWDDTKKIVLDSFYNFSPKTHSIASKFFDNSWIDAKTKIGKQSGAYCSYISNTTHPYIFMNATGDISDVTTLAHEMGHAIHGYLSTGNNLFEYHPSTATAEIASVFAESLVFDKIYEETKDKKVKLNLLGYRLQNSFATVFRQNAFYLFEKRIYEERVKNGELSKDQISNFYQEYLQPMFGSSLKLTDNHKNYWTLISHFYHYNFYVFTYAFGELLAMSLYAIYKKDGTNFADRYIKALSLGGSKTPEEITKSMGVDITKPDFWQSGVDLINEEVNEFIRLSKEI
jgi:oligoendopeptidase F